MTSKDAINKTRKVMKRLALEPVREIYRDDEGVAPIVVALPNEYISNVVERVKSARGTANVAVAFNTGFRLITVGTAGPVDAIDINEDLSMGMFMIRLDNHPGKSFNFKFTTVSSAVDIEHAYA